MGLFNRKQKTQEIKDDFNYEEMMKKTKLHNIFDGGKLYNVINKRNKYKKSGEKTGLVGVYNKNNKLLVVLKYDLDQNILFNYLLQCRKTLDYIFDKIEISPVTIEEKDETLLSNYSNSEILEIIKSNTGGIYLEYSINKALNLNKTK